jgi:hypothetical protein
MSQCSHVTAPTQFVAAGTIRSEVLCRAVERALRAPSLANTQPWRWRIGENSIELHADWDRQLTSTDPDRRDLIISCGAALHHLRVALAALGWSSSTRPLPDPENAAHLATVYPGQERADWQDAGLASAIERRRTDRRHLSARPVPPRPCRRWLGRRPGSEPACT